MRRKRIPDRTPARQSSTESPGVQQFSPGRCTLTEGLVVQRREADATPGAELAASGTAAGKRTAMEMMAVASALVEVRHGN